MGPRRRSARIPADDAHPQKSAGTESPLGRIDFIVRFTDGSFGTAFSQGAVNDPTPFDDQNPVRAQWDWYEWDPQRQSDKRGRFVRLGADPVDGATAAIATGNDIDIGGAKTPRAIRFDWTYAS